MNAKICVMVLFICVTMVTARLRDATANKTEENTKPNSPAGPRKIHRIARQLEGPFLLTQRSVKGPAGPSGQPGGHGPSPGSSSNLNGQGDETSGARGGAGPAGNPGTVPGPSPP